VRCFGEKSALKVWVGAPPVVSRGVTEIGESLL